MDAATSPSRPRSPIDTRGIVATGGVALACSLANVAMMALVGALDYAGGTATLAVAVAIALVGLATVALPARTAVWIVNGLTAVIAYLWGFIMLAMLLPSPIPVITRETTGWAAATYVAAALLFFTAATACALAAREVHRVWRQLEGGHGTAPRRSIDVTTVGGHLLVQRRRDTRP